MLLFGAHQIAQYGLFINIPFLDNYADPFLGIPCLLGLVLIERSFFLDIYVNRQIAKDYRFSVLEVIVITTVLSILFEEGFSRWSNHFTKDYWDYLGYFLGAVVFLAFINKPASSK